MLLLAHRGLVGAPAIDPSSLTCQIGKTRFRDFLLRKLLRDGKTVITYREKPTQIILFCEAGVFEIAEHDFSQEHFLTNESSKDITILIDADDKVPEIPLLNLVHVVFNPTMVYCTSPKIGDNMKSLAQSEMRKLVFVMNPWTGFELEIM